VVEPVRRELSAERVTDVVNDGQGLGKIRTEPIGGHVCNCWEMSGEASQEEGWQVTFVAVDVGADQHRCRHRCGGAAAPGSSFPRLRWSQGPRAHSPRRAHGATPDDGPGVPVDHNQRVVQMPAAHS
jgi:hypothetical protein